MLKTIDYRSTRAMQICIVFVTTLALQRWLLYSHAGWIGFAVMMIYAGFDPGTSIHRTLHRFGGAILGLLLSYFIWIMGLIDYRIIIIIIPVVVFLSFFSQGTYYALPTMLTVTLTAMGTYYYSPTNYDASNFFFDYFRSTLIALCICVFFESIIFKRKNVTYKFYAELQQSIVIHLQQLLRLVSTSSPHQSRFLKLSVLCNAKILELNAFLRTAKYDYHLSKNIFIEQQEFNVIVEQTYFNIRKLFILTLHDRENLRKTLLIETRQYIGRLERLSNVACQEGE